MVQDNVKKVSGRTISEEDSETLSEHLQESDEFREMYVNRSSVHDEVEVVKELREEAVEEVDLLKQFSEDVSKILETENDVSFSSEDDADEEMAALLAVMNLTEENEFLSTSEITLDASMRAKAS